MTLADDARGPIGWRAASCFRYRATAAVPLLGRSPRFRYWIVDRVSDAMP